MTKKDQHRLKDPQPTIDRIEDLAKRILGGDIILPKFQRSFVWDRTQIIDLLDSVMKNYPIGSVLLWQSRQKLKSEDTIADLEASLPRHDYPVNYLLDGQQRLSTVCGALFWKGSNKNSRWNIAYDLNKGTFFHVDHLNDLPPTQFRLNMLQDPSAFFKQQSILSEEDSKAEAELLFNRFKDYKIATVTLGDMDIEEVAPIFERINSTGTSLTIVDLMRAATWSMDFDLIDSIEEIKNMLEEKNFFDTDKKNILRSVASCLSDGYSIESIDKLRAHDDKSLKESFKKTSDGYKLAVDFLKTELNVPSFNSLPYSNQLVVLVHLFVFTEGKLDAYDYRIIKSWFWKTSLSGYFGGWNTGDMSRDYSMVSLYKKSKLLNVNTSVPNSSIWMTKQFRSNNAVAKMFALLLSFNRPNDLITGNIINTENSLHWKNSREFHHFFPKSFLKKKGIDSSKINCLANFIYLSSASNKEISNRAPSEYLKDIKNNHTEEEFLAIMQSNLISNDALQAALDDNFDKFLTIRSNDLHEKILKMI